VCDLTNPISGPPVGCFKMSIAMVGGNPSSYLRQPGLQDVAHPLLR
jgi:hypothetical protein